MSSRFSALRFSAAASDLSGPVNVHWSVQGVKQSKVAAPRSRGHLRLVKSDEKNT